MANAGDSRCVLCRKGQAIEMSIDHKPEDAEELERIRKAGGKVTLDGRVNGGLNLSRAIGDHAYKSVSEFNYLDKRLVLRQSGIFTTNIFSSDLRRIPSCRQKSK